MEKKNTNSFKLLLMYYFSLVEKVTGNEAIAGAPEDSNKKISLFMSEPNSIRHNVELEIFKKKKLQKNKEMK